MSEVQTWCEELVRFQTLSEPRGLVDNGYPTPFGNERTDDMVEALRLAV